MFSSMKNQHRKKVVLDLMYPLVLFYSTRNQFRSFTLRLATEMGNEHGTALRWCSIVK